VEKLKAQGLVKEAITSYKLGRLADGKNDGEITFGGLGKDFHLLVSMGVYQLSRAR
jgi:hypothetical protein